MSSNPLDAAPVSNDSESAQPAVESGQSLFPILAPVAAALAALTAHVAVRGRIEQANRWWSGLPFWQHPYSALLEILLVIAGCLAIVHLVRPASRPWIRHGAPLMAGAIGLLALWNLITQSLERELVVFFPTPDLVFGGMIEDWQILLRSARQSLVLLLCGYALGASAGIATGILVGWFPSVRYWAMPALKVIGPIPATALIALVMVISAESFLCGVALIGFVVWFPVTMLTSSGISSVRLSHLDVARTLGAGELYLIFRVAFPSAAPNIFIGLFMGLLASFLTLVVAETVGVEAGLGHYFKLAQGDLRYDKMYGALVIMALFCSGLLTLLFKARDAMLHWQQGVIKW